MPRERTALEIAEVTADAFFRCAGKHGGFADMTLPARGERVLPVEWKRVHESSRCPAVIVVATSALPRIKLLLQLLVERIFRRLVVWLVTRRAVLGGDRDV